MSELEQHLARLSPKKRRELALRLDDRNNPPARTIPRVADRSSFPLSFAQQRLWFLDTLGESGPQYHISSALRIQGSLQIPALKQALDAILSRHEALRTNFVTLDGVPRQIVTDKRDFHLPLTDLTVLPEERREEHASRASREEATRRFDLSREPLLRAALFRLAGDDHLLQLTMHHIVSDGWSMEIFFRELAAFYEAYTTGKPPRLLELPVQYPDFAVWQRQKLQGEFLERLLRYWKQHLDGIPGLLTLHTDRPRPAAQTYRGGWQPVEISARLMRALKDLSLRQKASLFMTLHAAFKVLLCRHSGQTDIVLGLPIANRNMLEIEGLIGFFANTLALHTDLSGNPSSREVLRRVREAALEGYEHQDLPFEKLVEELQPRREPSHSPLFQAMMMLQNFDTDGLKLPGLAVHCVESDIAEAKFDLILMLRKYADGLRGRFVFNTDLFDRDTIARMAMHFRILLENIVADPDQPISGLPLMTARERDQILLEWNHTRAEYPRDTCIHRLFEIQVERTPVQIAVVFDGMGMSYRRLNSRANQIARQLRAMRVGPDVLVGVFMERSAEMVMAMLGILKAGGAYLPLDPDYPAERLSLIIEDSRTAVILTEESLRARLPLGSAELLIMDTSRDLISRLSDENLPCRGNADDLAYVMYTSGSTGGPKGVAVPHRAVNRLVVNTDYVQVKPDDVVAQVSNAAFDAATFEIWGALLNGARLVGVPRDVILSPRKFAARIDKEKLSVMFLTTALFHQFARELPSAFKNVRCLLFGGETAQARWVEAVMRRDPPQNLVHVYGPTETTTFATWHRVETGAGGLNSIPIGRPIANTRIHVLDQYLQPVPIGVTGELYIGGDGLARGYHNRPVLTAEKFIPDPFAGEPGARLYRTGDMARYLPDGSLEFLGRLDQQVKIRGFRVELGEIETVIGKHPMVRDNAVLAPEDACGARRLVCYVSSVGKQPPTPGELRSFAQEKLPDYMVPSFFVVLDRLPLSPNGKVDHAALSCMAMPRPHDDVQPLEDDLKRRLVKIWEAVLGVHPIGTGDSFFELGGHSLLAVRLVSRIEKIFGRELPVSALFRYPTVDQLHALLRQQAWDVPPTLLAPIQPCGSNPPFFMVHGDLSNTILARYLGKDQPLFAIVHQSQDGKPARHTTVSELATFCIGEIQSVQSEGPYFLAGYSFGGLLAFEIANQLQNEGHTVSLLVLLEPTSPNMRTGQKPQEPGTPAIGSRIEAVCHEVRRHLDRLRKFGAFDRFAYVWTRVVAKFQHYALAAMAPLESAFRVAVYKLCLSFGWRMPLWLQSPYLIALYRDMARSYRPPTYPGRVVLLGREDFILAVKTEWEALVAGGLDVRGMQAESHMDLVHEPGIHAVCEQIKKCLEEAQAPTKFL